MEMDWGIPARAEALGGTFHIEGTPGKGTLASFEIPITQKNDKRSDNR